jgi:hypothetical protein
VDDCREGFHQALREVGNPFVAGTWAPVPIDQTEAAMTMRDLPDDKTLRKPVNVENMHRVIGCCNSIIYQNCNCSDDPGLATNGLYTEFDAHNPDQWMAMHNNAPGFPKGLQGVFWMDGNGDERQLSFAKAKFIPSQRRLMAPIYDSLVWASTYPASNGMGGTGSLSGARQCCCMYDVFFTDESYNHANIYPSFCGCCYPIPSCCVKFTLERNGENSFNRRNTFCGNEAGHYEMKRVASSEGRTPHFEKMVRTIPRGVAAIVNNGPTVTCCLPGHCCCHPVFQSICGTCCNCR